MVYKYKFGCLRCHYSVIMVIKMTVTFVYVQTFQFKNELLQIAK